MFCPRCSQKQISEDTRFCSSCGFLLTGVAKLIASGGATSEFTASDGKLIPSPKKRGLKQGTILFFSGIILVPILGIITSALNAEGYLVGIVALLTFLGGILRMLYALLFESKYPTGTTLEDDVKDFSKSILNRKQEKKELSEQTTESEQNYLPPQPANWRDTNDWTPSSVTEETTSLLKMKKPE